MDAPSAASGCSPGLRTASPLIGSKRARKREQDRLFQRKRRLRTKARIAELEKIVDIVSRGDQNGTESSILRDLEQVKQQRDSLSKALDSILRIARSQNITIEDPHEGQGNDHILDQLVGSCPPDFHVDITSPYVPQPREDPFSWNGAQDSQRLSVSHAVTGIPPTPSMAFMGGYPLEDLGLNLPSSAAHGSCACVTNIGDTISLLNIWRSINDALHSARHSINNCAMTGGSGDDLAIRAVLNGWNEVQQDCQLDASWEHLRRLDQLLLSRYGNVERLGALRICRLLLEYHLDPTPSRFAKLPTSYRERPSQLLLDHSYAIDFLGWPGVRERFVFHEHKYCANQFWHLFAKDLHFDWPFELRDCFTRNTHTGQYMFSSTFEARSMELSNWQWGPDILAEFPEFESDVAKWKGVSTAACML